MAETQTLPKPVVTPDGRTLLVHEAGDPTGWPLVVHHGTPGAGVCGERAHACAAERGLRLIGFDRAGYGGSHRHPGRRIADVAADVGAILDALGVERFATWGSSGGGPHALACASLLADRCSGAISISGVAPIDAEGLDWLAAHVPGATFTFFDDEGHVSLFERQMPLLYDAIARYTF